MSKIFLLSVLLTFSNSLFAQDKTTVIRTDSSVITSVCKAGSYKSVEERFRVGNRIRHTSYHEDTLTIKNSSYSDTLDNFIGVQKIYDKKGQLILSIDHTRRTWKADTRVYPSYPLLVRVKARADSVLQIYFGKEFIDKYARWDIFNSCYFAGNSSSPDFGIDWTREDYPSDKPTRCYVVYNIMKDGEYRGTIRMLIDTAGKIQHSQLTESGFILYNEGFKKFNNNEQPGYKLTINQALKIAETLGLEKGENFVTSTAYTWERDKKPVSSIFNGNTRLIISQSKKSDYKFQGDVRVWAGYTNKWVFDPWTGKFIEKRKVKND